MTKSNKQLAKEHNTTSRQISRGRKRGWIYQLKDGELDASKRVRIKLPRPARLTAGKTIVSYIKGRKILHGVNWRWFDPAVPLSLSGRELPRDSKDEALRP